MKLGCCVNMLASKEEPVGMNYIPYLKAWGYDYAELPLAQVMELPEPIFRQLIQTLEQEGIPCECCNNFFPGTLRLTGTEVFREKIRSYLERALDRAAILGAEVIVFGSSAAKNVPEGFDHERAFEQVVETLQAADRLAGERKIQIAIEPLNRKESNLIRNLTEGERLRRGADFKNVFLLADYYHFTEEAESIETLDQLLPSIIHVHFAEPAGRIWPAAGKAEYEPFFKSLRDGGYGKRVSIEAYSKDPRQDIEKGVVLRSYF